MPFTSNECPRCDQAMPPRDMTNPSRREAQKFYESKDYSGALAILDKASSSDPKQDELIAILDLRVSICLKLEDRVSARKVATQMIRTNRADGRGYLRLGQLERLTGDYNAAIKWYEHGLKRLPKDDRLRAYIMTQHTKTMTLLKELTVLSKPVDPLTNLPAEIVEMIVASFNYREAAICLSVSKTWRHLLSTYSVLRNTIDFSHVGQGKFVTFSGIKAALRRSQKAERPVLVVAKSLTQPATRHLKETMERWIYYTKMQHLEVDCPSSPNLPTNVDFQSLQWHRFQLRTLIFGPEHIMLLNTLFKILQCCDALQQAVFSSVESSSLELKEDSWVHSIAVSKPNLRILAIHGSNRLSRTYFQLAIPVCTHLSVKQATSAAIVLRQSDC